jgi:hypothetical protein
VFTGLERLAAAAGLAAIGFYICLLAFTTDGPRPDEPVAAEAARIAAHSDAIRASAVLGAGGGVCLTAFVLLLALAAPRRGPAVVAAVVAATIFCALDLVSEAAVTVSAQSADTGLGAAAIMSFGHLHTTTLLLAFAPLGVALAALATAQPRGRIARWSAYLIATGGILCAPALLSVKFDEGPFGPGVVIVFLGMPIWVVATSVSLLLRQRRNRTVDGLTGDAEAPLPGTRSSATHPAA